MRLLLLFVLLLTLLLPARSAQAHLIEWLFEGQVTRVVGPGGGPFDEVSVGDTYVGRVVLNTDAPNEFEVGCAVGTCARYRGVSFSISLAGIDHDWLQSTTIDVLNDYAANEGDPLRDEVFVIGRRPANAYPISIYLRDPSHTAIGSSALPAALDLANWSAAGLLVLSFEQTRVFSGTLTSFRARPVPEPLGLWLVAIVLGYVLAARQQRASAFYRRSMIVPVPRPPPQHMLIRP